MLGHFKKFCQVGRVCNKQPFLVRHGGHAPLLSLLAFSSTMSLLYTWSTLGSFASSVAMAHVWKRRSVLVFSQALTTVYSTPQLFLVWILMSYIPRFTKNSCLLQKCPTWRKFLKWPMERGTLCPLLLNRRHSQKKKNFNPKNNIFLHTNNLFFWTKTKNMQSKFGSRGLDIFAAKKAAFGTQ